MSLGWRVASVSYTHLDVYKRQDLGSPSKSSTTRVSIQILGIPEETPNPPVFRQPNQKVEVTESDSVGFLVALVQAIDEDGDLLWYKITGDSKSFNFHPLHHLSVNPKVNQVGVL